MKTLVGSLPKPTQVCWKFAGAPARLLEVAKRSQEHNGKQSLRPAVGDGWWKAASGGGGCCKWLIMV